MSGSNELEGLLKAARPGFQPQQDDQQRLRRSLTVKLAASVGTVGVSGIAWGGVATKALLSVAALGVAAGVWYRQAAPEDNASQELVAPANGGVAKPAPRASAASVEHTPPLQPEAGIAPDQAVPRQPSPAASARGSTALAEEAALVLEARSALRAGDPGKVLTLLASYETRFPSGALRQEVHGTRVLALCDLGRSEEAARRATLFMKSWPGSPMAARLSTSCVAAHLEKTGHARSRVK